MSSVKKTLFTLMLVAAFSYSKTLDRIIAVVDADIILESELKEAVVFSTQGIGRALPTGEALDSLRVQILEKLIEDRLLMKEVEAESIQVGTEEVLRQRDQQISGYITQTGSREALEEELQKAYGLTLPKFKKNLEKQIREQMLKMRLVERLKRKISPTKKEIENFYKEYRDSLPKEKGSIHLGHIMKAIRPSPSIVDSVKKTIIAVETKLLAGESFEKLAEQFSDDPASADQGGDLGFFEKGFLDKTFEKVAFGLNIGQVSGVTRSRYGFHLIRLEERRERQIRVRHILKLVNPSPKDTLQTQAFLDSLRENATTDEQFVQAAKAHSDDDLTQKKGGNLGWMPRTKLSPAYKKAISGLSPGEICAPVLIEDNFHIFRLFAEKKERGLTLDNDFEIIREMALNLGLKNEIKTICERVRQKVHVENRLTRVSGTSTP